MNTSNARCLAIATIVIVLGVLGMGVIMAVAMTDMGGHMLRGSSGSPQTPTIFDAAEATIEIRDFDYFPHDAIVNAGAKVTWTNRDSAPHTATDDDGTWDTDRLGKNESATLTIDEPGAYDYYCTFHPYMKATLTVR